MGCTSNERRAERRKECREALAAHIYDKLKLVVLPHQVRLQPSKQDGYAWSALSSKKYLLEKNLASCTAGVCLEIMKELGKSIEVVLPPSIITLDRRREIRVATDESTAPSTGRGSFTVIIEQLEDENRRLTMELERSQDMVQKATCSYHEEEAKTQSLEAQIGSLHLLVRQLRDSRDQARIDVYEAAQILQKCNLFDSDASAGEKIDIDEMPRSMTGSNLSI